MSQEQLWPLWNRSLMRDKSVESFRLNQWKPGWCFSPNPDKQASQVPGPIFLSKKEFFNKKCQVIGAFARTFVVWIDRARRPERQDKKILKIQFIQKMQFFYRNALMFLLNRFLRNPLCTKIVNICSIFYLSMNFIDLFRTFTSWTHTWSQIFDFIFQD